MTSPSKHDEPTTLGGDGKWHPQINLQLSPTEKRTKDGLLFIVLLWAIALGVVGSAFVSFVSKHW
ncbi:MAG TPA: hypothetical protein PLL30_16820 [Candidatus Krumholzibacteria bacterium]|nr:hypothetical protein [Candidatus Krumholzibacteria bacterium]HRY42158.1 hypothetical protein [Candidatus Krumholzibacteria bacterium]